MDKRKKAHIIPEIFRFSQKQIKRYYVMIYTLCVLTFNVNTRSSRIIVIYLNVY